MKTMKVTDIEERIAKIASVASEKDGAAHGLEDGLFLDVLKAIANGAKNPKALAAAATKSADLKINRWFE